MTPAEAIMILIWIAIIAVVAYVVEWFVSRAFHPEAVPQPLRFAIWGIAALAVLLVLFQAFDVWHFDAGLRGNLWSATRMVG